jgi:hypothetical protein
LQGPRPPRQAHKEDREVSPLLCALRRYWGRVDLICIPIGHAGKSLNDTASDIATALAKVRPSCYGKGKSRTPKTQESSKTSVIHDTQVAKTLLGKFCSRAQTRLLGIIAHRKKNQRANSH